MDMVHEVSCQHDVGDNEGVVDDGNMMVEDVDSSRDDDGTSEEVEAEGGYNYLEGNEHDEEAAEEDNASHVAAVDDREDSAVRNHMADDTLHDDDDDEAVHVLLVDDRIHELDEHDVAPSLDDDD